MMMPSIFGENLFDDFDSWFSDPVEKRFFGKKNPLYGKHAKNLMKTDVRETKNSYEVDVDLPGFKKDEIKLELDNGYLTISAAKGLDKDEIMVFGDNYNDISMFDIAGYRIAMGNAIEEIKEKATYVTADCAHDGIYQACLHYHLIYL